MTKLKWWWVKRKVLSDALEFQMIGGDVKPLFEQDYLESIDTSVEEMEEFLKEYEGMLNACQSEFEHVVGVEANRIATEILKLHNEERWHDEDRKAFPEGERELRRGD